MINLKGKTALITGGSRGIGRATALMFAEAGANVAINYINNSKAADEVVAQCDKHGVAALAVKADVSVRSEAEQLVRAVVEKFGRIDSLVNNAGIWERNDLDGMDDVRLRRTIDVNLYGVFYPTIAAVPYMKKQKSGTIILISSTAGQRGEAFHSPYAATKGALISLTKSWGPELVEHNIRVNCVAPGWFDTDMSHEALVSDEKEEILSKIPMGRAGHPRELAGAVLFLASDLSTFMTGEILNVNGGAVLCG